MEKKTSSTNGAGVTGGRKIKIDPYLSPHTKLKSKFMKDPK